MVTRDRGLMAAGLRKASRPHAAAPGMPGSDVKAATGGYGSDDEGCGAER
jgi:hypothetical protein